MAKILGLSFFYHDAAAVLLIDGQPIAMSEEERFSRKKHDSGYPEQAIDFVLKAGNLSVNDLDYVVFYEKPFIKFERVLKTLLQTWPSAPRIFGESLLASFTDKLWLRGLIAERLDIPPNKVLFSNHHLSHAAASFLPSPYKEAAILTVDGIGEWATTTIGHGRGSQIEILKEIHFPHSLGLLYSAFTAFLGFEVNEGEYKVMGMAPYGAPRYADKVRQMIEFLPDGSFRLDLSYFEFHRSLERSYSRKFLAVFGEPRVPGSKFFTRQSGWLSYFGERPSDWEKEAERQQYYADVAASVQLVTEEAIVRLAQAAHKLTGSTALAYGGGVALNCVANRKLISETPFKQVFIQPAAGDAGGALGAALMTNALFLGERNWQMKHAYYGSEYSDAEIKDYLEKNSIPYRHVPEEKALLKQVAGEIAEGKVIGWFQGRFEWGPRALGSRSILGDPRNPEMKNIINVKIKFREPYRPFAPSVLAEHAEEYFELDHFVEHYPARFMLYVTKVREEKQATVPAITHVDGTARPQAVFSETSPKYWGLINEFRELTGVPLILNTSFNLKGEPIVTTPENAYATFTRGGLDLLVLGSYLVTKK